MKGVGWFPRHPDQSACVKGENDKQTNESGGSTGKQSGEVRGKEGEGKGKPLSLSLPSLLLFHLRRLLNAQRAMDSSREILLPPSLPSSSNLARERGRGEVV